MIEEMKKQLSEYEIIPITIQNFKQVFQVYDTNQDFFLLTEGKKTTVKKSINDINALPPNTDISQKTYVSIWKDDKVVAVLDLIEGYPWKTSVWLGLLLVHGSLHSRKIGSSILNAVLTSAKKAGYKSIQLGVFENNVRGLAFWQRHGFNVFRQSQNVVIMGRRIVYSNDFLPSHL